jgi:hypothetical protein
MKSDSPITPSRTDAIRYRLPGFWYHLDIASETFWYSVRRVVEIVLGDYPEFGNGEK